MPIRIQHARYTDTMLFFLLWIRCYLSYETNICMTSSHFRYLPKEIAANMWTICWKANAPLTLAITYIILPSYTFVLVKFDFHRHCEFKNRLSISFLRLCSLYSWTLLTKGNKQSRATTSVLRAFLLEMKSTTAAPAATTFPPNPNTVEC